MFGLPRFPLMFLFMKSKEQILHEHASSHYVTGFTRIFCQKGLILLENGKTGFFCFTRVGEPAHISKISHPFGVTAAWHTVLICCTMCSTEQPKEQPQIGDRGSNLVAINQF